MDIDKEEIRTLFSRIMLQDREAFTTLYQRTSGYLYTRILLIVRDRAIAADLLQEGYIKIWHGKLRSPIDAPWAWLCQVMRNQAIDHIRQHGRRGETALLGQEDDLIAPPLQQEKEHRLTDCLSRLEAEKRSAIVLAWYHGFSHPEIASHLSAPQGTIKSWIRRGLSELKQCLSQ